MRRRRFRCTGAISADNATTSPDRSRTSPSFLIRAASASASGTPLPAWSPAVVPRLDRVNSSELLREARRVYYAYLSTGSSAAEPVGIVLSAAPRTRPDTPAVIQPGCSGRAVFDVPVLLPDEHFVPIDWLRNRANGRSRPGRPAGGRPPL